MNKLSNNSVPFMLGLLFCSAVLAEGISRDEYQAGKDQNAAHYKSEKAACGAFSGNAKDICVAEAKGREKISKAEIELAFRPGASNQQKLDMAKADARYGVARERCDDSAGTAKDVCVEEAKAGRAIAKAEATKHMKMAEANDAAMRKTSEANRDARSKSAEARKDAAETAHEAKYEVAKERCDTYASEAKEHCLSQAKKNFGRY